jgi:hypothetical protein
MKLVKIAGKPSVFASFAQMPLEKKTEEIPRALTNMPFSDLTSRK